MYLVLGDLIAPVTEAKSPGFKKSYFSGEVNDEKVLFPFPVLVGDASLTSKAEVPLEAVSCTHNQVKLAIVQPNDLSLKGLSHET